MALAGGECGFVPLSPQSQPGIGKGSLSPQRWRTRSRQERWPAGRERQQMLQLWFALDPEADISQW